MLLILTYSESAWLRKIASSQLSKPSPLTSHARRLPALKFARDKSSVMVGTELFLIQIAPPKMPNSTVAAPNSVVETAKPYARVRIR